MYLRGYVYIYTHYIYICMYWLKVNITYAHQATIIIIQMGTMIFIHCDWGYPGFRHTHIYLCIATTKNAEEYLQDASSMIYWLHISRFQGIFYLFWYGMVWYDMVWYVCMYACIHRIYIHIYIDQLYTLQNVYRIYIYIYMQNIVSLPHEPTSYFSGVSAWLRIRVWSKPWPRLMWMLWQWSLGSDRMIGSDGVLF